MGRVVVALRARSLPGPRPLLLVGLGLIVVAVYVLALSRQSTYETWSPLVVGPLLVLVSLPILARQARRENDRTTLLVARSRPCPEVGRSHPPLLHDVRPVSRSQPTRLDITSGAADQRAIPRWDFPDRSGLAHELRTSSGSSHGDRRDGRRSLDAAAFLVFSWLAFWGLFLFYRAFTIAVPEGRRRSYAHLVFFLPALLFWPSSIGKESWMIFALGIGGIWHCSRSLR